MYNETDAKILVAIGRSQVAATLAAAILAHEKEPHTHRAIQVYRECLAELEKPVSSK